MDTITISIDKTPNDLMMREALIDDHDAILNITKGEILFGGRDYIPNVLQEWLQDGFKRNSNRRNFVFLLKGENQIVGFRSIYFQNGGTAVAFFGRRIYKNMRGKGFGRRLSELTVEYLKSNYPSVTHSLSFIGNLDLTDTLYNDSKHGKRLTERACKTYQFKMETVNKLAEMYAEPSLKSQTTTESDTRNQYKLLTKDEFKEVLRNKHFISEALVNDTMLLNLVPVIVKTEGDYEFAATNSQNVLVEGSVQNPIALSIFSCQLPSTNGRLRTMTIDYFIISSELKRRTSVVKHLAEHLRHYKECNKKNKEDEVIHVEIFTRPDQDFKKIENDMQRAGVDYQHVITGIIKLFLAFCIIYLI